MGSILAQPRNALGTKLFELTNQLANLGVPSEHVIFGGDEILCEYDASTVIWAKLYDYSFIICVYYVYKLYIFWKKHVLARFSKTLKILLVLRIRAILRSLKISLVHVIRFNICKLHSQSCCYVSKHCFLSYGYAWYYTSEQKIKTFFGKWWQRIAASWILNTTGDAYHCWQWSRMYLAFVSDYFMATETRSVIKKLCSVTI